MKNRYVHVFCASKGSRVVWWPAVRRESPSRSSRFCTFGIPTGYRVGDDPPFQEWAGTAHLDVMRELMATTNAKVLLAIDSYNELFQPSMWHYGDDKVWARVSSLASETALGCRRNPCCCRRNPVAFLSLTLLRATTADPGLHSFSGQMTVGENSNLKAQFRVEQVPV